MADVPGMADGPGAAGEEPARSPWARPRAGETSPPVEPRGVDPHVRPPGPPLTRWGDPLPGPPLAVPSRPAAVRAPLPWHSWLAFGGGMLAIAAAFMTWASARAVVGGVLVRAASPGTDKDLYGVPTLLLGLLAVGLAVAARAGRLRREAPAGLVGCGLMMLVCCLLALQKIADAQDGVQRQAGSLGGFLEQDLPAVRISGGAGLWLTFAAAGLLVLAGLGGLLRRRL